MSKKHSHYHKDVSDRQTIDIYGVCEVFEVDDVSGRLHHAIKKILMAGKRGSKGYCQDIQEAVDTLNEKLRALDGVESIEPKINRKYIPHDGGPCPINTSGAVFWIGIKLKNGKETLEHSNKINWADVIGYSIGKTNG